MKLLSKLDTPSPISRHRSILDELRMKILRGELSLGQRLPTRDELSQHYASSKLTVQKALEQLANEGLVEAHGRNGTFVVDQLPVRGTYGMVFCSPLTNAAWQWSPYWNALAKEAAIFGGSKNGGRFVVYHNVTDPMDPAGELYADLQSRRLSGLVVVEPLLWQPSADPGVPCVEFGHSIYADRACASISFSWESWIEQAVNALVRSGRKRVALFNNAAQTPARIDQLVERLVSHGLTVKPQWVQGVFAAHAHWARRSAHLLMDRGTNEPPDAMLVTDDSLIEPAITGLMEAGVTVPDDVEVIGHANFPWPTSVGAPIRRLGYDLHKTLDIAVDAIEHRRMGLPVEPTIEIGAEFQNHFQSTTPLQELATAAV